MLHRDSILRFGRDKMKDGNPFRDTLARYEFTLASDLMFCDHQHYTKEALHI